MSFVYRSVLEISLPNSYLGLLIFFSNLNQQLARLNDPERRRLVLEEIRALETQRLALIQDQTARYVRENDNMERGLELARARLVIQAAMRAKQ